MVQGRECKNAAIRLVEMLLGKEDFVKNIGMNKNQMQQQQPQQMKMKKCQHLKMHQTHWLNCKKLNVCSVLFRDCTEEILTIQLDIWG